MITEIRTITFRATTKGGTKPKGPWLPGLLLEGSHDKGRRKGKSWNKIVDMEGNSPAQVWDYRDSHGITINTIGLFK